MRDIDVDGPAFRDLQDALERYRVNRSGAEPRPAACVGGRACLEPPRQPDGRVKCATCGHGFDGVEHLLVIARLALALGRVDRVTFHPDGRTRESDTDHTVMLVWAAVELASRHAELGLDVGLVAVIASVHDMAETYADDTNTLGGLTSAERAAKREREARAIARLRAELGPSPLVRWLDAYERQELPEARFVRYLDKVLPRLTHAISGGGAVRSMGRDAAWFRERNEEQAAELAAAYPEFAGVLGPLLEQASRAAEAAVGARS